MTCHDESPNPDQQQNPQPALPTAQSAASGTYRARVILAGLAVTGLLAMLVVVATHRIDEPPVETSAEPPSEQPADEPAAQPIEKLVEKPVETVAQTPVDAPDQKLSETSSEASEDPPSEKPADTPVEKSAEIPGDKPASQPDDVASLSPELRDKAAAANVHFKPDDSIEAWEQLGRAVLQTGTEAEFQEYQKARMATLTAGGQISPSLVNEALRLLYAEQRWDELERFEKRLDRLLAQLLSANAKQKRAKRQPTIANPPSANPLLVWMYEWTLGRSTQNSVPVADLHQPLVVPVSKMGSLSFQELWSALEDKQYKDAARSLTSGYALRDQGLIAVPGREQHFVSYRGMQLILLRQSNLAEAVRDRLDDAAQLRIQQTMSQGDPAAIESLTTQYCGTPVHAAACQWLGDRALTGADFTQALSWYEEGSLTGSPEQQPDLAARVRLASAMLGKLCGEAPAQAVAFGEIRLSPEQFERRVRDAVARQAKAETASPVSAFPILPVAQPVQFRFAPWDEREESGYRNLLSERLAATAEDDLLIVSDRRRAVAIESASGKVRWRSELGKSGFLNPIRPLVQGERVYLRTIMASHKYGVVCLDRKTGRVQWRRDCGDAVAGDPQLIQGRLVFLTLGPPSDLRGQATTVYDDVKTKHSDCSSPACLVQLNPESGEVLSRRHVAEASLLRSEWAIDRIPEYQSICVGNRLVVLFYGAVLCVDPQGTVEWLRNSNAIPSAIDPPSPSQLCQPPRESGGRLYLQQPGSCAVECLLARTGELAWRRGIIGLQQILDLDNGRLLVQSAYGLTTLDAATGKILWRRELPGLLSAVARNTAGQVVCTRKTMQGNKAQLAILWIDATTGEIKAHSLPSASQDASALETVVVRGDRMWCLGFGGMEAGSKPVGNGLRILTMQDAGPAKEGDLP